MIGFFGTDRNYYFWMLKKYKQGVGVEKLKYWMFQKEMKEWQKMNELKRRAQARVRNETAAANR
jgi:hypothetical protein